MRSVGPLIGLWGAMWFVYWVHPYTVQNMMSLSIEVSLGFIIGDWVISKVWGKSHR